jgi:aminoglycoside phosphotransferase (APT) family kinase protein
MHPDELDTDAALVERLLTQQFPHWAGLSIEPVLTMGTDNALYRLGDDMVVRLPRRPRDSIVLEKECRWLPKLAPLLPLDVPIPLAKGAPGAGFPLAWSVYSWLRGENAVLARLTDLSRAASDLARFLAALQEIDPAEGPPPGEHNAFRGAPLAERDEATRSAIASLGSSIDDRSVSGVWKAALRAPEWDREPVWIHGDLDARNVLAVDGYLSAVIDFGCLGVGDPAYDVMVAWKMLSRESRQTFRAALAVDDATWARARGLALSQSLMALSYYTLETNAVLVLEARRWLAEVLDD